MGRCLVTERWALVPSRWGLLCEGRGLVCEGRGWGLIAAQLVAAHHVVHGALHLQEHALLLPLRDPPETHSVAGHAHQETLLEAALLAAVTVHPHDGTVLVLQALLILDILLDAPTEEALASFAGVYAVVEPGRHVSTHLTQQHQAADLRNAALGRGGGRASCLSCTVGAGLGRFVGGVTGQAQPTGGGAVGRGG